MPLTKNEQRRCTCVALLKRPRCNSSRRRVQHAKTWSTQCVSCRMKETRMAQGLWHQHCRRDAGAKRDARCRKSECEDTARIVNSTTPGDENFFCTGSVGS